MKGTWVWKGHWYERDTEMDGCTCMEETRVLRRHGYGRDMRMKVK